MEGDAGNRWYTINSTTLGSNAADNRKPADEPNLEQTISEIGTSPYDRDRKRSGKSGCAVNDGSTKRNRSGSKQT